jgi:uncharacterized protein YlzI (FlbEa/FlbD family)
MVITDTNGNTHYLNVFHISRITFLPAVSEINFHLLNGEIVNFMDQTATDFIQYNTQVDKLKLAACNKCKG